MLKSDANIFLHSDISFSLFLLTCIIFLVWCSSLYLFPLYSVTFFNYNMPLKLSLSSRSWRVLLILSSLCYIDTGLISKFLILFEFLGGGLRYRFCFNILHAVIQFLLHVLKCRLCLLHYMLSVRIILVSLL